MATAFVFARASHCVFRGVSVIVGVVVGVVSVVDASVVVGRGVGRGVVIVDVRVVVDVGGVVVVVVGVVVVIVAIVGLLPLLWRQRAQLAPPAILL